MDGSSDGTLDGITAGHALGRVAAGSKERSTAQPLTSMP